jgi:hypothetical protein
VALETVNRDGLVANDVDQRHLGTARHAPHRTTPSP